MEADRHVRGRSRALPGSAPAWQEALADAQRGFAGEIRKEGELLDPKRRVAAAGADPRKL